MTSNSTIERFNSVIEKRGGLSLSEIVQKDTESTCIFIERNNNSKLKLDTPDNRVPYSGNPLLYSGRVI
jgi:hypothetical protein